MLTGVKTMSKIESLIAHGWRNVKDYSITYNVDEEPDKYDYVNVMIQIGSDFYTFSVASDIYYHLMGSDEIIFHKNILDLCMLQYWLFNPNSSNAIRYVQLMLIAPYDMSSLQEALLTWLEKVPIDIFKEFFVK